MTAESIFRIGLLRLTDAAPLIIAQECGYFGRGRTRGGAVGRTVLGEHRR